MLSDAIKGASKDIAGYRRGGVSADPHAVEAVLTVLECWETEARNMEARLEELSGRPHVPLAGQPKEATLKVVGGAG